MIMPSISRRVIVPAKEYQALVATVLMEFQWLEESLKQYLLRTELLIQDRVKDDFRYEPSTDKIWKLPLGNLLVLFEKHCGNAKLIARIRPLIKDRNDAAHSSFVLRFDEKLELVPVEKLIERLKAVELVVRELPDAVAAESRQIGEKAPHLFGFSGLIKSN